MEEEGFATEYMTTTATIPELIASVVKLKTRNADLLAALEQVDSIATGKKAKAILRVQEIARAAIARAGGKPTGEVEP